jgi:DNA polymerase-3 subunit alpha
MGTVLAKDKLKHSVLIQTTTGAVPVKIYGDAWATYDKQISAMGEDGHKHVLEKSWFQRGNMIMVLGIRRGDEWIAKKYKKHKDKHLVTMIESITPENKLVLREERVEV